MHSNSKNLNMVPFMRGLPGKRGGAVVSWLVHSSPDQAVWVQGLARDTVVCSWARHLTLTAPFSTQEYK